MINSMLNFIANKLKNISSEFVKNGGVKGQDGNHQMAMSWNGSDVIVGIDNNAAVKVMSPDTHTHTAAQVGASAQGHKHSAGDMTSGILPVARGGTGQSTMFETFNIGAVNTTYTEVNSHSCRYYPALRLVVIRATVTLTDHALTANTFQSVFQVPAKYATDSKIGAQVSCAGARIAEGLLYAGDDADYPRMFRIKPSSAVGGSGAHSYYVTLIYQL